MDNDVYFYSVKPIEPNTELLVWYSRDYAQRINYPPSCEYWNLGQKISKYSNELPLSNTFKVTCACV